MGSNGVCPHFPFFHPAGWKPENGETEKNRKENGDRPHFPLMDERAGRAIAQEHGLSVAGTAAVIGMAKARQLIPSARAVFERLHDSDFRISAQVIEAVLRRAGE